MRRRGGEGGRGKRKKKTLLSTPDPWWQLAVAPLRREACDRDTVEEEGPLLCVNSMGGFC